MANILHFGAAPAINGLIVIPHHEQIVALSGQQSQPSVLDGVGILKLIHQDMGKALLIMVQDIQPVPQQLVGTQQQFGKIHRPGTVAGILVGLIDRYHPALVVIPAIIQMLRSTPLILLAVYKPLRLPGRPFCIIQVHLPDNPLEQAKLVIRIQDLEGLGQTCLLPMGSQQAMGQAMEGTDPHAPHRLVQQCLYAVPHLPRCLIGEGYRQNVPG